MGEKKNWQKPNSNYVTNTFRLMKIVLITPEVPSVMFIID